MALFNLTAQVSDTMNRLPCCHVHLIVFDCHCIARCGGGSESGSGSGSGYLRHSSAALLSPCSCPTVQSSRPPGDSLMTPMTFNQNKPSITRLRYHRHHHHIQSNKSNQFNVKIQPQPRIPTISRIPNWMTSQATRKLKFLTHGSCCSPPPPPPPLAPPPPTPPPPLQVWLNWFRNFEIVSTGNALHLHNEQHHLPLGYHNFGILWGFFEDSLRIL